MAAERISLPPVQVHLLLLTLQLSEHVCRTARIDMRIDQTLPTDVVRLQFIFLGKALANQQLRTVANNRQHAGCRMKCGRPSAASA